MNERARPPRILVIDDSPRVRSTIRELLTASGYVVSTAASATEGLARCAENQVDLIVTELKLPDLSGLEVGVVCRERFPMTRVGLVTSWKESINRSRLDQFGVDFLVVKPFLVPGLLRAVAAALDGQTAEPEPMAA
jgi:DNA-binding response OmpR family regulator